MPDRSVAVWISFAALLAAGGVLFDATAAEAQRRGARAAAPSVDDILDMATAKLDSADFAAAVELLEPLETAPVLTREQLVRLYLLRCQAYERVQRAGDMGLDIQRLISLEPRRALPANVRPAVRQRYREALDELTGDGLRISLSGQEIASGARIEPRVEDDLGALATAIRFAVRVPLAGQTTRATGESTAPWQRSEGTALEVAADRLAPIEIAATILGPGGSVIATLGTEASPHRTTIAAILRSEGGPSNDPDPDRDGIPTTLDRCPSQAEDRDGHDDSDGCPDSDTAGGPDLLPLAIVGGSVAAVGLGVLIVILATSGAQDGTRIGGPPMID